MVAKLSSARIILAASFVTSVPVMPMATPMSAAFSAGASLTPSPVIATTWPSACSAATMRSLCAGATRAKTEVLRTASLNAASSSASSSVPLSAAAPASMMPRSAAMRAAVRGWSPVIMMTRMPARRASRDRQRGFRPRRVDDADGADEDQLALDRVVACVSSPASSGR